MVLLVDCSMVLVESFCRLKLFGTQGMMSEVKVLERVASVSSSSLVVVGVGVFVFSCCRSVALVSSSSLVVVVVKVELVVFGLLSLLLVCCGTLGV